MLRLVEILLFLVLLGFTVYFRLWHENYCRKLSQTSASMGEFTLLLTGIPYGKEYNGMDLKNNILKMF